jgi:hypothetical protein
MSCLTTTSINRASDLFDEELLGLKPPAGSFFVRRRHEHRAISFPTTRPPVLASPEADDLPAFSRLTDGLRPSSYVRTPETMIAVVSHVSSSYPYPAGDTPDLEGS